MLKRNELNDRLEGYEHAIFDLDNTIYDQNDYDTGAFEDVELRLKLELGSQVDNLKNRLQRLKQISVPGIPFFNRAFAEIGIDLSYETIAVSIHQAHDCRCMSPADSLYPLLRMRQLNGKSNYIVTNGPTLRQSRKLRILGLEKVCKKTIICPPANPHHLKPNPWAFTQLQIPREEHCNVVMVGDMKDIDGKFAEAAGIPFINFSYKKRMIINGRQIDSRHPPYIIAEMSNNHLRDLDIAKNIIKKAKDAGADAVKIQTYTADSLTIDCRNPDFIIPDTPWKGKTYYDLYSDISMPLEWTRELFDFARSISITIFSSPFDAASVDLLEKLDCPAYKIASFEANDPEFVTMVASSGKPVLISTGVSSWEQINECVSKARDAGARSIAVLHCISEYPASIEHMNLDVLNKLKDLNVTIGLSDHSTGLTAALGSTTLGANIIEKHFTLSRKAGGPDASFSVEPDELTSLCRETKAMWAAIGNHSILNNQKRSGSRHKRSLYVVRDISKGETFTKDNIRVIRPAFGVAPKYLSKFLGQKAAHSLKFGTRLSWKDID